MSWTLKNDSKVIRNNLQVKSYTIFHIEPLFTQLEFKILKSPVMALRERNYSKSCYVDVTQPQCF